MFLENPILAQAQPKSSSRLERRYFIGGSDARVIMGQDEAALLRLWLEKRGELELEDLSGNLVVQLGVATEELNRRWYQAKTARSSPTSGDTSAIRHCVGWQQRWTAAWRPLRRFSRLSSCCLGRSRKKPRPRSTWRSCTTTCGWSRPGPRSFLSVITGGGKWVEITTYADPLYQHLIVTAERKFWRCVESGEPPRLFGVEPPKPRIEAVRIVDMSASNSWGNLVLYSGVPVRPFSTMNGPKPQPRL